MQLQKITTELFQAFVSNLFPQTCIQCKNTLVLQESFLCTSCQLDMPRTGYHTDPDNPLARKFLYEQRIRFVSSFLYFRKSGVTQKLIHHLKYKGQKEIGVLLGQWYAHDLRSSLPSVDAIVPVPLHQRKLRKRGYNQCDFIAQGLSEVLGIPFYPDLVYRIINTQTQTKKSRVERIRNVDAIFSVRRKTFVSGKKFLLVDDVMTTGATLGELASVLLHHGAREICIASIASGK